MNSIDVLINELKWALLEPNAVLVDFDSVKGLHSTLSKDIAIVEPSYLAKLDNLKVMVLWFPITCNGEEWLGKWTEDVYGAKMIRFPAKAKNIILVDSVCDSMQNWIRKLPMVKGHQPHEMHFPNDTVKNYCVMHWVER